LLITVDCGIASVAEAALAKELGLELIVTDHHHFADELPAAACLVHPRLPGSEYPFGQLCGAGVAFKLAWAICQRLGDGKKASPRMRDFLVSAVSLAAVGTVADVVPLVGENRILVRYGLNGLKTRASLGLKALLQVCELVEKSSIDSDDVGFSIAPRLNAAGRLGQARLAVELLTTENAERAVTLAQYIDEQNKVRQTVERRIFKQAKELVETHPDWAEHPALVLAHHEWHQGVIGIVASRVAEHYERPAVLISMNPEDGLGQGSARSFARFDLHAGLTACRMHLRTFGGHQAAAGLRVHRDQLDIFREDFCRYVAENHRPQPSDLEFRIDAEVRLADLTHRAVTELDRMGPFGSSNPRPVFVSHGCTLAEPPRKIGNGERHLSLTVRQYGRTMRGIAFGRAEWAEELTGAGGPISIGYAPCINRFRGKESVEFQLIDWRPEHSPTATATTGTACDVMT
jgi:single-stranded-DNA-specific exonuclease